MLADPAVLPDVLHISNIFFGLLFSLSVPDILEEFGRIFNYNLPVGKKIDYATEFKYGLSKLHKMMSDKRRLALAEGEAELRYPTMDLCFLNVVQHTDKQKRAKGSYSRFFWEPSELPENNSQLAAAVKVSLQFLQVVQFYRWRSPRMK